MARAGLSRDRLADIGAELADDIGFEQVTVSELARTAGVKPASLYSHVSGSDDLRTLIALRALDDLADVMADAVAGRSGRDALAAFADACRDFARDHPGLYAATRYPLDHGTAVASGGARSAEMMRAILRGYDLAEEEQVHAVRLMGSTVHGFIALETSQGFSHSSPSTQETWPRIIGALDAALRAWRT